VNDWVRGHVFLLALGVTLSLEPHLSHAYLIVISEKPQTDRPLSLAEIPFSVVLKT
jgi:hypothetical protein